MAQYLKISGIGNLGRDPDMRYTPDGRPVTSFSVAVSHSKLDRQSGEWKDDGTDWFRISTFGDFAERMAERLRKGTRVFFEGKFRTREWERQDGAMATSLDVRADTVVVLKNGANDESDGERFTDAPASPVSPAAASAPASNDFDDLPF